MTNEGGRLLVLCSRIFFTPELYCQHDCEHIDCPVSVFFPLSTSSLPQERSQYDLKNNLPA